MSNTENFEANWHHMKTKLREKWGKLTENDIAHINGKRENLISKLVERYDWDKKSAEEELKKFENNYNSNSEPKRKVG